VRQAGVTLLGELIDQ